MTVDPMEREDEPVMALREVRRIVGRYANESRMWQELAGAHESRYKLERKSHRITMIGMMVIAAVNVVPLGLKLIDDAARKKLRYPEATVQGLLVAGEHFVLVGKDTAWVTTRRSR